MRRTPSPASLAALVGLLAVLPWVAACGGGGSSGGGGAPLGLAPPSSLGLSVRPETIPGVERRTWDAALAPLARLEALLAVLARAAPPELVNEPPYLAQVDGTPLFDGGNPRAAARPEGRSSGVPLARFEGWTIESTRVSNGEPLRLRASGPGSDPTLPEHRLFVELTLERDARAAPPFGTFSLHVAAAVDAAGLARPLASASLVAAPASGGRGSLQLYLRRGDLQQVPLPGEVSEEIALALSARADGGAGEARVFRRRRADEGAGDSGIVPEETLVAYDAVGLLRARNGGPAVGYSRSDAVEHVLRYELVHAQGPQAGEPVVGPEGSGWRTDAGAYFWLDQAGLWSPDSPAPSAGDAAAPSAFGVAPEAATHALVEAPGRFLRLERRTFDLAPLEGRAFEEWSADGAGELLLSEVRWNQGLAAWQRSAVLDPETGAATPVTPALTLAPPTSGVRELWSDDLGGTLVHLPGRAELWGFAERLEDDLDGLFGAAPELPLAAWVGAPRANLTGADLETGTPFLATAPLGAPHRYVLRREDLALFHDVLGDGSDLRPVTVIGLPARGPWRAGLRSGPLLAAGTVPASPAQAWDRPRLHVFETGPHPWNRRATVTEPPGDFVGFAPAPSYAYTHRTANDRAGSAAHDGYRVVLSHAGPGRLRGLPVIPRDTDGDGRIDRHWPSFSLADGTRLGEFEEVEVRACVIELELREDGPAAAGLDLLAAGDLVVPSAALWSPFEALALPTVPQAPRVVDGVFVPPARAD